MNFSLTTFNKTGKLLQIEYALNRVQQGKMALGIKATNGVVIATDKKVSSVLVDEKEYEKGCYFCSDVAMPHADDLQNPTFTSINKTTADVSLDCKCTATRPGVAYIASGIAVELLITIISERNSSTDSKNSRTGDGIKLSPSQSNLLNQEKQEVSSGHNGSGTNANASRNPHQIRGNCFNQKQHYLKRYDYCVACSDHILHAMAVSEQESESLIYHEFYRSVFSVAGPHILMEISGSTKDKKAADAMMQDVMPLDGLGMYDDTTRDADDEDNFEI